jgi:hypothetical protein
VCGGGGREGRRQQVDAAYLAAAKKGFLMGPRDSAAGRPLLVSGVSRPPRDFTSIAGERAPLGPVIVGSWLRVRGAFNNFDLVARRLGCGNERQSCRPESWLTLANVGLKGKRELGVRGGGGREWVKEERVGKAFAHFDRVASTV